MPKDKKTGRFVRDSRPRLEIFLTYIRFEGDCWIWTGGLNRGYGVFYADGKTISAHRFAYQTLRGPIPAGLQPDHLCRNPSCVNPAHMEIVTPRENTLRSNNPTAKNARKTTCVKGHDLTDPSILYVTPDGRRNCRICRREAVRRYEGGCVANG